MKVPDQSGKVAIVTGSNTGIGEVAARELARAGARVYLACRSAEKATQAMARIRTEVPKADLHFLKLDLGSLDATRRAAEEFLERDEPIDLLVNNAGLCTRGLTKDGFELTFGVNHIGPFLFTMELLGKIIESAPARIVNVSSHVHRKARGIPFDAVRETTATTTAYPEYADSKLANILFTRELSRRLEGTDVAVFAVHPGAVATDIWRRVPWPFRTLLKSRLLSVDEGAAPTLLVATEPGLESQTGSYWHRCDPAEPSEMAQDTELGLELWRHSLQWTGATDYP